MEGTLLEDNSLFCEADWAKTKNPELRVKALREFVEFKDRVFLQ